MKHLLVTFVAALTLAGCTTPSQPPAPVVNTSKSQVSTESSGGTSRTEEYSRESSSNATGANTSTHQKAQQTNPDGTSSEHTSDLKTSSNGYGQDDHHIVVSGTNVTHEFTAKGEDLAVSGNANRLVFRGKAHGLSVTGSDNQIEVDAVELIDVTGKGNRIVYSGPAPQTTDKGQGNSITAR